MSRSCACRASVIPVVVFAVVIGACGLPKKTPPTYTAELSFRLAPMTPESREGPRARSVIAAAKTVAFTPPDWCRGGLTVETDSVAIENPPPNDCAVLLARLESAAMAAGFEVVSWQTLQGARRPIAYARENGIDLLFELNDLRLGMEPSELYKSVNARFYESALGQAITLRDTTRTLGGCLPGFEPALGAEAAVKLDLKMVSVRDGRVHWTYRATHSPLPGGEVITLGKHYEAIAVSMKGQADWKVGVGAASLAISLAAGLVTTLLDGVSGDEIDIPKAVYLGELALLGTGIYMLSTINSKAYWRYTDPGTTLCVPGKLAGSSRAFVAPGIELTAHPRPVSAAPATSCKSGCGQRDQMLDKAIRAFMDQLTRMRGSF